MSHFHCPAALLCCTHSRPSGGIPGDIEGLAEAGEADGEGVAGDAEGLPDGDEVASGDGEAAVEQRMKGVEQVQKDRALAMQHGLQ